MTNPAPAAGWYPDPQGPGMLRWWDGAQWTSYTAPIPPAAPPAGPGYAPTPPGPRPEGAPDGRRTAAIVGVVAGGGLILGSFLPWVRVTVFGTTLSRSGIDDGGDGWFTFVAGGVVAVVFGLVLRDAGRRYRGGLVLALLAAAVALLVGIVDWADVHDRVEGSRGIGHVGVGLYLVVVAAVAGTVASVWCLSRSPADRPSGAPRP